MANWKHALLCMFIILSMDNFLFCFASDHRELYIIYMGSLPEGDYSSTAHHLGMLQQVVGDDFAAHSLVRSYKRSFNGFAAKLTEQEAQNLTKMDGVVSIFQSKTLHLHTTRSWDFMGFQDTRRKLSPTEGDLIIGVIDTGVWPESDSFSDEGFGPAPEKWKGTCAGGKNFTCNKKIIGARNYIGEESARDTNGHGSHTASIAAGNRVRGASFYGIAEGVARGGVPSARLAVYKVCQEYGCLDDAILAAFDDAIGDGVDVISISMGSNRAVDFMEDSIAIGSFHAMEKGILTVKSGGNSGPGRSTTDGAAPWLLSVAASTTDRRIIDKVSFENGLTLSGRSINGFASNGKKMPLVLGEHASLPQCEPGLSSTCSDGCLDPQKVKGKIVLCSSHDGLEEAYVSHAFGSIVEYDDQESMSEVVPYPTLSIDSNAYALALSYANSTASPRAEILRSEDTKDPNAPVIAIFSSRGPNKIVPEIMKPDISAPGVEILAAFSPMAPPSGDLVSGDKRSVKYNIISGTSMACPHVAGAAAYVKSFHPDWSPAAIKSSIMTTATPMNGSDGGLKYFAYGSGLLDPIRAIDPGLVFDLSKNDYVNLLCDIGYDTSAVRKISGDGSSCPSSTPQRSMLKDVNYPSVAIQAHPMQPFTVNFTRTVTNVGFPNSTYKVSVLHSSDMNIAVTPQILSFKSIKEEQSFVVNVAGRRFPKFSVLSASLVWTDGKHHVRIPIIVDVS